MNTKGGLITAVPAAFYRRILPVLLCWLGLAGLPLPAAAQNVQLLLQQTSGRLYDLALSPDQAVLAVAGDDNTVHLWDSTSGEHLRALDAPRGDGNASSRPLVALPADYISSVTFHPSNRLLAASGTDRMIRLWDYNLGTLIHTLSGHAGPVRSLAFHPQGGVLASAGEDGTIRLWNANNGERMGLLRAHEGTIHDLAFSRNGDLLASAGEDGQVRLWDFASGKLLHTLSGHQGRVAAVAFSPLSPVLASAGQDGTVRLWQQDTGALIRVLTGHRDAVTDLDFPARAERLASVGLDGQLLQWALPSGNRSEPIPRQEHSISAVGLVGEATAVTTGLDGITRLWNLEEGHSRLVMALLPDGEWLAYDPRHIYYNASARGDRYAMLRFPGLEQTLFPLHYYAAELFQPTRLDGLGRNPGPVTAPTLEPRVWRLRWDRLDARLVAAVAAALVVLGMLLLLPVLLLRRRRQQLPIARRCLSEAGFGSIRPLGTGLKARRGEDEILLMPWTAELAQGVLPAFLTAPAERASVLYLVHDRTLVDVPPPAPDRLAALASRTRTRTIPLWYPQMAIALAKGISHELFDDLERFQRQQDPYPLSPPHSLLSSGPFFDRDTLLDTLAPLLAQGRHVGLFGLRHMGKTALSFRLAQQLSQPAIVVICQDLTVCAEAVYVDILGQFRALLTARGLGRLPKLPLNLEPEEFEALFLDLHRRGLKKGMTQPVAVMLDGIHRFMPNNRMPGYEAVLAEYTQLLRTLIHLAEAHSALVLLVNAERPDTNRRTNLSALAGENPLHQALHEVHLGPLDTQATLALIQQLGAAKGITWQPGTAERLHALSGGHPWITARLASDVCRQGRETEVDHTRLEQYQRELMAALENHPIGAYYRDHVWNALSQGEQQLLGQIAQTGSRGMAVPGIATFQQPAVDALEELGVITRRQGRLLPVGELFSHWLADRMRNSQAVEYRNPLL